MSPRPSATTRSSTKVRARASTPARPHALVGMRSVRSGLAALFPLGAALVLGAASLFGCAQNGTMDEEHGGAPPGLMPAASQAPAASCSCDDTPVVDPKLLAFLSIARSAHHEADLALEASDRPAAIAALERVVHSPWSGKKPPELVEVTADTLARLADLRSEDGKFEEAARDVNDGIALATEPTHFRGRLFEVRGLVEERRSRALKEKGDTAGADKARKAAMDAFGQAMDIQEDVISRALKEKEKQDAPRK